MLDVEDDVLESVDEDVCQQGRLWLARCVPKSVPERGPQLVILQPTPTMRPIKNGPEIVISGPFWNLR